MKILLVGSGGREHALAYALAQSPALSALFIAPGNPGMENLGTCVPIAISDSTGLLAFARDNSIALVIIGPEAPLVAGLADEFEAAGIAVFGPSKAAAQLEGSKDFTKSICDAAAIPTAAYATFTSRDAARAYIEKTGAPIVVKYDGLMAGKGVTVAQALPEALEAVDAIYANEPTAKVVIEECLIGEEVSFFCLIDGESVVPFGSAQDHKRVFDGDLGPNTGGMGAYSPALVLTAELERRALDEIVIPTAREMAKRGTPYRGVLYAGLILTADGPKLIEYNCRFGDPECQVLMLRLDGDLVAILHAVARGKLKDVAVRFKPDSAICVVMATKGYPGDYASGSRIGGLEKAGADPDVAIFHAGTRRANGQLVAAGGRVLGICARGQTLADARTLAYAAVANVDWPDGFCRSDIGARGIAHLEPKG